MAEELIVKILENPPFYSLYADGTPSHKRFLKDTGETLLYYPPHSVLVLYYTYPSFRAAALVRNSHDGKQASFPCLSHPVLPLFELRASKIDKLRRAIAYLQKHSGCAFNYEDGFYLRLYFLLQKKGKLDYSLLATLTNKYKPVSKQAMQYKSILGEKLC